jgi:cytidylate kinase
LYKEDDAVSVITVFRQVGDGGHYIAETLAHALGCHFFDDYLIIRSGLEGGELNSRLRSFTLAAARQGNVVMLGRGCFALLQGLSDVLNVRLMAPLPLRIGRVMQAHQMTHDEAAAFVAEKDAIVADVASNSYGLSPDDLTLFDLVINTGKVPLDLAVHILAEAVGVLKGSSSEGTMAAALQAESDME